MRSRNWPTVRVVNVLPPIEVHTDLSNFMQVVQELTGNTCKNERKTSVHGCSKQKVDKKACNLSSDQSSPDSMGASFAPMQSSVATHTPSSMISHGYNDANKEENLKLPKERGHMDVQEPCMSLSPFKKPKLYKAITIPYQFGQQSSGIETPHEVRDAKMQELQLDLLSELNLLIPYEESSPVSTLSSCDCIDHFPLCDILSPTDSFTEYYSLPDCYYDLEIDARCRLQG